MCFKCLTFEHDLLFQTINHVSNEELKKNILETLRGSLTRESSSKPSSNKKTVSKKSLSKLLQTHKEETLVSIDKKSFKIITKTPKEETPVSMI